MKICLYLVLSFFLASASTCKKRARSTAKSLVSASDLLDISKLPMEEQLTICSQNILLVFIGNAQGFGAPPPPKSYADPIEALIYKQWAFSEMTLDQQYLTLVQQSDTLLKAKIANSKQYCAQPGMYKLLQDRRMIPGSVTIVSLIDGPNTELWDQSIPDLQAKPDSTLKTTQIGFDKNGKWRTLETKNWLIENNKVVATPTSSVFEANVPEAFDLINSWIVSNEGGINNGRPFTQTSYIVKGHGSRIARTPYLGMLSTAPLDSALSDAYLPGTASVFMVDPVDRAGSQDLKKKTFYTLLWSSKAYCLSICKYQGTNFANYDTGCHNSCLNTLKTESEKSYADLIAKTKKVIADAQGQIDDLQGSPKDTEGSNKDTEGSANDTEGSNKDTEGNANDTEGSNKDTEGSANDTEGSNKDTEGRPGDTEGGSSLTFGSADWGSETQGQKTPVQFAVNEPGVASIFDGHPSSYRKLGQAKSLQSGLSSSPQTDFRIVDGTSARSFILLDTCSVALWSNRFVKTRDETITTLAQTISNRAEKKDSDLIVLANPMPLLKSAVNFASLNAFQMVLLSSKLYGTGQTPIADEQSAKVLSLLLGKKTPKLARSEVFSRLYATRFNCVVNSVQAGTKLCKISDGMFDVYIREQLALASRNLKDRLGDYHKVKYEFNVSPSIGAGKSFREIVGIISTSKDQAGVNSFHTDDQAFWQSISKIDLEKIIVSGFANPSVYERPKSHSDGFSWSVTSAYTWSSADRAANKLYRTKLSELLASTYGQAADANNPEITIPDKVQFNVAVSQLASAITVLNAYFKSGDYDDFYDPWQGLLTSASLATSKILNTPKLAKIVEEKKDLMQSIKTMEARIIEINKFKGFLKRSESDLNTFKKDLLALRTKLTKAIIP